MSFCSWDLYEYSLLQNMTKHSWVIKTGDLRLSLRSRDTLSLLCRPVERISQDFSVFNDCNLSNVKLYLNSEFYPYNDLNLNLTKKDTPSCLYYIIYARFRKAYYGIDCFEMLLNMLSFIEKKPFAVIDCLRQNESVKSATVDIRIELQGECVRQYYCLIIHDHVIEYCPLSNVRKCARLCKLQCQ